MKRVPLAFLAAVLAFGRAGPARAQDAPAGSWEGFKQALETRTELPQPPVARETASEDSLGLDTTTLRTLGQLGLSPEQIKNIWAVSLAIRQGYVDDVPSKKLYYGALKGMAQALDPFSTFFTPEEFQEFNNAMRGGGAIGVGIFPGEDKAPGAPVVVWAVFPDSPAEQAGLKAGDQVLEVNGRSTLNMEPWDWNQAMSDEAGTTLTLKIRSGNGTNAKTSTITLTRAVIAIPTINWAMLPGNVGYIQLAQFGFDSADKLHHALDLLQEQGARALILDLRGNPGGALISAVQIAYLFLDQGQVIVTGKRRGKDNFEVDVPQDGPYAALPLAVLINGASASASEVLAGALQDNKRAIIVGQRSYGKGTVQTVLPLPDGSALKLTTQRYYTPSGRSVDRSTGDGGILPDAPVPLTKEQSVAMDRQLALQLLGVPAKDPDPVLQAALKALASQQP